MTIFRTNLSGWVGALFASHFLGYGLFLPFFPLVLEARGLSENEIGFILGLSTIVRIFASPILTNVSDRSGRRRLSIFAFSILSGVFLGLFAGTSSGLSVWITVAGFMFFWSPIVPLSDAYALDVVRKTGADYAHMRLWGSVAFVVANLAGGSLASTGRPNMILAGLAFSLVATGLLAIGLPGQGAAETVRPDPDPAEQKPSIFKEGWFLLVLCVGGLLQATHAAYYGFGTLFWIGAGIDEISIGFLWAIGVVAEIGLFYMAKRLSVRLSPIGFMTIAAGGSIVRWTLFPFAEGFVSIATLQVLHALSFAAAHLGSVGLVSRVVPQKWTATGQGLLSTSSGLQQALGLALCGPLYELSPAYPFWAMAVAALIALLLLGVLQPLWTKKLKTVEQATG